MSDLSPEPSNEINLGPSNKTHYDVALYELYAGLCDPSSTYDKELGTLIWHEKTINVRTALKYGSLNYLANSMTDANKLVGVRKDVETEYNSQYTTPESTNGFVDKLTDHKAKLITQRVAAAKKDLEALTRKLSECEKELEKLSINVVENVIDPANLIAKKESEIKTLKARVESRNMESEEELGKSRLTISNMKALRLYTNDNVYGKLLSITRNPSDLPTKDELKSRLSINVAGVNGLHELRDLEGSELKKVLRRQRKPYRDSKFRIDNSFISASTADGGSEFGDIKYEITVRASEITFLSDHSYENEVLVKPGTAFRMDVNGVTGGALTEVGGCDVLNLGEQLARIKQELDAHQGDDEHELPVEVKEAFVESLGDLRVGISDEQVRSKLYALVNTVKEQDIVKVKDVKGRIREASQLGVASWCRFGGGIMMKLNEISKVVSIDPIPIRSGAEVSELLSKKDEDARMEYYAAHKDELIETAKRLLTFGSASAAQVRRKDKVAGKVIRTMAVLGVPMDEALREKKAAGYQEKKDCLVWSRVTEALGIRESKVSRDARYETYGCPSAGGGGD